MINLYYKLPITLLLCTSNLLVATERDTIGHTDLIAREPDLDGSGLRVAQIEAPLSNGQYQPNPASASQNSSKFSYFDSDTPFSLLDRLLGRLPTPGIYESSKQSGHANSVANNYYDFNTGIATDVDEIFVFEVLTFYNNVISNNIGIGARVINQSFVFGAINTTIDERYDNYAVNNQVLFTNGVQNSTGIPIASPSTSYNGITVGRENLNHSPNPADGRSKPDIIAPGSASSFATPFVGGSAAILIEAALEPLEHGGSGTAADASAPITIKALILNGAVKDAAWSNTETHPLDTRRGAGLLNVNHSHLQLQGGQHSPTNSEDIAVSASYTPSSSETNNLSSLIGWNHSTITNPLVEADPGEIDTVENYYFDLPSDITNANTLYDLSSTLVWNRQNNQSQINNLDLVLYNIDTQSIIEQSISTVDNVEHIYFRDLPPARYALQVIKRMEDQVSFSEDYSLAFNFSVAAPDAPSSLSATAQPNSQINLTWTDNSADELNFELQRSTISNRLFSTIATLPADTTSYADTAPSQDTLYYYRVKATNNNGDSFFTNVASARTFNSLMNWRFEKFGNANNTGDAANDADPDHDGMSNLTEYALGTDPTSAAGTDGGSALPTSSIITIDGTDYLQITVNRAQNRTDINYTIETSATLNNNWEETTEILENTATTLRVRDTVSSSDVNKRFIRLIVTEDE